MRCLDRFLVIYEVADVLQLDVQVLDEADPVRRPDSVNCVDQAEVVEIRAALERYDKDGHVLPGPGGDSAANEPAKAVGHAWMTKQHPSTECWPGCCRNCCARPRPPTPRRPLNPRQQAAHLLGQVYQISSSTLRNSANTTWPGWPPTKR